MGTLSGTISGAGGSLIKTGSGAMRITGNNTYDGGTTINQGRLLVSNTSGSGTGSGAVTVSAGTIGGTGSISGTVTINSGGHIAPGESIESLAVGSLVVNTGSFLDFELGAPGSPGVNSDLINVINSGGLTLSGGAVTLTDAGGLAAGTYTLIDYAGAIGGNVANLGTPTGPAGFTYSLVNNTGNTSIDLLVAAPAPAGDWNGDTKLNAADYVTWRKDETSFGGAEGANPSGYATWRENFDLNAGASASLSTGAVPEPATMLLLAVFIPIATSRRRARGIR
jgi:autotransporter-associated beta strand protein